MHEIRVEISSSDWNGDCNERSDEIRPSVLLAGWDLVKVKIDDEGESDLILIVAARRLGAITAKVELAISRWAKIVRKISSFASEFS